MTRIFQILFSLFVISGLAFSQVASKDISQTPSNFNNPEYVYGPELENPTLGFAESFEGATFPPAGWLKANPDGGTGWNRQLNGTTPIPGWTGGTITVPPGGGTAVAFCTWNTGGATANDQWLITPQITNVQPGDMLTFWMLVYANASYAENFDIRISTTGTNVANFTTIVQAFVWPVGGILEEWISYSYQLTNYVPAGSNIYIAFREHVADNFNDGGAVLLDLVEVTQGGGGTAFTDNFDSYTAGQSLCSQTTEWETWTGTTGTGEDPLVSTTHAYSSPNGVRVIQNNDFVRLHGNKTTGKWFMSFAFYIPATKSGYFNTMNVFTRPSTFTWGMDSYFDVGGAGRLDTTGGGGVPANTVNFTWAVGQWNQVIVIVDLDAPNRKAEYWIGTTPANLTQVATWNFTQNGTKPTQLACNDFFGAAATDEMYIDNYYFGDAMPPIIPVELTSFTANVNTLGQVVLNWETATEVNNQGFEIERRSETSEYRTVGFVEGYGTTTEPRSYVYTDRTAENGINYYRLKQVDFNGTYEYSDEVEVDVNGPLTFDLAQNYPNPFNPSTSIKYSVPESGNIRLSVFNIVGEEVAVLVDGFNQAGFYEVAFDASNLPSGVYVYKLQSANSVQAKKMMLLK